MFTRNQLVHAVLWPLAKRVSITMLDAEGVVHGEFVISKPMLGSELARMVPDGLFVAGEEGELSVFSMSGDPVIATRVEFDTEVVTEKREMTLEERFAQLEMRQRRAAEREARLREQNKRLAAEAEAALAQVVEQPPVTRPETPGEGAQAGATEPQQGEVHQDA